MASNCGPYKQIPKQIFQHPALAVLGCWRHESSKGAWAVASLPRSPGSLELLGHAEAGAGGLELCSLWQPVAGTCGPYKKIIDQICSILLWLPEAGVARVPK